MLSRVLFVTHDVNVGSWRTIHVFDVPAVVDIVSSAVIGEIDASVVCGVNVAVSVTPASATGIVNTSAALICPPPTVTTALQVND